MTALPLDLLVSPLDGAPLRRDGDELVGGDGGERYAIRGGVPRMVPSDDGAAQGEPDSGTAESFGGKWALLSDEERKAGETMMICVSRCKGRRLVLDI